MSFSGGSSMLRCTPDLPLLCLPNFSHFARCRSRWPERNVATALSWPLAFQRNKNYLKRTCCRVWMAKSCGSRVELRKNQKIHGIPKDLGEISWKSMKSMKIFEILWKSLKIIKNHWNSLKIIENHWKINENQWKSLKIAENCWKLLGITENQNRTWKKQGMSKTGQVEKSAFPPFSWASGSP